MPQPNVGHIDFLNVTPLGYAYRHHQAPDINICCGAPSQLNRAMREGTLDVSNVSSILYAKKADDLVILPDVCISADGAVKSILLVSRVPIEQIGTSPIALTQKSETSHALVKIILSKKYAAAPTYSVQPLLPDTPVPEGQTATLFIGDDALWLYHHRNPAYYYYDIGTEWKVLTGKKMVYALFVANKTFAHAFPNDLQLVYNRITDGFRYGLHHRAAVIREAIARRAHAKIPLVFQRAELEDYLGPTIQWALTDAYIDGLQTFYRLAFETGLIKREPALTFASVDRIKKPLHRHACKNILSH